MDKKLKHFSKFVINRQSMIFKINIKKLQIICKTSSMLTQKEDKNSLTYDKMKNVNGLMGHTLSLKNILSQFKKKTENVFGK